jgi:leucyl aminopeptidase (aminopeptidase T)
MEQYKKTVTYLLEHCGSLVSNEKLAIICDSATRDLAELFKQQASLIIKHVELYEMPMANKHGEEPNLIVKEAMLSANLIISLCTFSLAHSQARIDAGKNGARFLSLPLYSWELLSDPSVTFNFKSQAPIVRFVTNAFTNGKTARVTTKKGTDITLGIDGRIGNFCPGFVDSTSLLGSPPDIESNVSPVEDKSEGVVVIDGSITCPEIGLLTSPVILTVKKGRITSFASENKEYVKILDKMFEGADSKRRVLAECGVGLNPEAKLTGTMLTDEGAMGCMHFGFGSNYTVGGQNKVDFHLDFVFREASLYIDDKSIIINGEVNGHF